MYSRTRAAVHEDSRDVGRSDAVQPLGPSRMGLMRGLISFTLATTVATVTVLGLIVILLLRDPGAGGALSSPSIIESTSVILGPVMPADDAAPRVALLFFGLTRSLRWTQPSIEANVVGPLREYGVQTDIFLHTYNDTDDAMSEGTDSSEWRMLHPSKYAITSQQTFIDATQCAPSPRSAANPLPPLLGAPVRCRVRLDSHSTMACLAREGARRVCSLPHRGQSDTFSNA